MTQPSPASLLTVAERTPLITNDAVILGILIVLLSLVFATESSSRAIFRGFYRFVPGLLLCYFLPGLLGSFGVIDAENSELYFVASRYLLPASLVLLTLSLDLPAIWRLGPKILVMFATGTLGVMIGGPIALLACSVFAPDLLGGAGPDAVWRGMTTVAGSWIGGGANQAAMKEVFGAGDAVFSIWIAVDVLVANLWLAVLLYGAGIAKRIDAYTGADTRAIEELKLKVGTYQAENARIASSNDLFSILGIGFGATALAHAGADRLAPWISQSYPGLAKFSLTSGFFWLIVISSALGVLASLTPLRRLEAAGASRIGSVFLYILVATIGMNMNLLAVVDRPVLFVIGFVWISVHALLMLGMAKLIKAPFFFVAVGSQANIGGAASAPVVASAFHPVLAPVGVMMAVLGYVVGTYGAWLCGLVLQAIAT
ncbi:hypothetical protein Poly30_12820 [Planctomycetes bacterium Poly30]|uniref:DUF819 domain-containing protein n=1 Tax=Saltatorellus ferox TaxID=2528018 RepID=A0A518ENW6_9BACT|nr:hypothetical protein Poly30_12820 [Planctomycetes bacterium Poly30]